MNTRVESIPQISEEECDGRLFLPTASLLTVSNGYGAGVLLASEGSADAPHRHRQRARARADGMAAGVGCSCPSEATTRTFFLSVRWFGSRREAIERRSPSRRGEIPTLPPAISMRSRG